MNLSFIYASTCATDEVKDACRAVYVLTLSLYIYVHPCPWRSFTWQPVRAGKASTIARGANGWMPAKDARKKWCASCDTMASIFLWVAWRVSLALLPCPVAFLPCGPALPFHPFCEPALTSCHPLSTQPSPQPEPAAEQSLCLQNLYCPCLVRQKESDLENQ